MMAEMEIQFDCEHAFLDTDKNSRSTEKIHVFWLPAGKRLHKLHGVNILAPNTMILCNPNMGFAEV